MLTAVEVKKALSSGGGTQWRSMTCPLAPWRGAITAAPRAFPVTSLTARTPAAYQSRSVKGAVSALNISRRGSCVVVSWPSRWTRLGQTGT